MKKEEETILSENSTENQTDIDKGESQHTLVVEENKKESNIDIEKKEDIEKQQEESEKEKTLEQQEEKKIKNKHTKERFSSGTKILITVISILFFVFISTVFAILNMNNSNIVNGVYIENFNISNLSKEEVINKVNEKIKNIEEIELNYGKYSTNIKLEEIGVEILAKPAINSAINLGKTNNIVIDNYSILKASLFTTKFKLEIKIDEEKFEETVKNIQAEIPYGIKEYSYVIKGNELIITSGKAGERIIKDNLKKAIIINIKEQFNENQKAVNIITKSEEPQPINIEKIYAETYKEAKDAYIIEEPFELHKEENGIDFAITMEEARKIVSEEKDTYTIPLQIKKPKIKIADLGDKLFKQTLAKYTTIYDAGVSNRAHNIALAANSINGTILLPGETFSYNKTIGDPSKENGYKIGTAYVGGKVVEAYGGGVCQVSSTLYNSVLYANLEIVQRYNHSYVVGYVPAGRDATVSYGGKDFKFKNTRNYPIKIVSSAKNGVVSVSIMGIKEETEYEVVLTSTVLSTTPRTVIYEKNSNMEEGKEKVIQSGYDGKQSIAYKTIKLNGKIISKTVLSKDTYKPMAKIIQVGTKKVSKPTSTVPETNTNTNTNTNVEQNTIQNSATTNETIINNTSI